MFFGSILNELLDRPFDDNFISTVDALQKTRIRRFQTCFHALMISHRCWVNLSIMSGPFNIIFQFVVRHRFWYRLASILTDFEPKMVPNIRPFGTLSCQKASQNRVPRISQSFREAFLSGFECPFYDINFGIHF